MNSRTEYTDEPVGEMEMIPDFLPPPEELVFRQETGGDHTVPQQGERRLLQERGREAPDTAPANDP